MIVADWKTDKRILLKWENPQKADCILYRKLTDASSANILVKGKINTYLDDDTKLAANEFPTYRIKIDGEMSPFVHPNAKPDKYLLGISGDILEELEMVSGHVCYVFCKSDTQIPCPYCWSEQLGKRIKSQCDHCGGSGKIGGWQGPLKTFVGITSIKDEIRQIVEYEKDQSYRRIWLGNTPILRRGDMIRYPDGTQYVVNQKPQYRQTMSEDNKQFFVLKQTVIIKQTKINNKLIIPNESTGN